ncbi:acetate--CoA ligase family protein [Mesorhizobium sp. CAU 1732]|uniref:acetate--CoA ligase family protein n=1 Tax=Mesorhizobium sp. CAU 1732 TaxID=3140358 RepID=UPI00325FEAF2
MREGRSSIDRLLRPRSVAVVGASAEPFSLGANVMANFAGFGFSGALHPVSRRFDAVEGHDCVAAISDLPDGIDMAALVVPAKAVRQSVADCAARGIAGAVVFASGFAELGKDGISEQKAIADIAHEAGMALLGPNCLGFTNFVAGVPMTFERVQPMQLGGPGVAVVAQSGAMTGNIREALRSRGLDIAYAISTGNEAALGVEDIMSALVDDEAVGSFSVFVEQLRDPAAFLAVSRRAWHLGKPVVLMHPGRSQRSREAAQSHTGAMVGDHAVMETFVRAAGVTLVDSFDELFDTTLLRHLYPEARIDGLGIVTNSGAVRGFCLDFCEEIRLDLPLLADATTRELTGILPDFATIDNPLDITAMGMSKPSLFGDTCRAMLEDDSVDALLLAAMGGAPRQVMAKWESLKPVMSTTAAPVAIAFLGDELPMPPEFLAEVQAARVPFFRSPERAMRAFANIARLDFQPDLPAGMPAGSAGETRQLAEHEGKALLAEAGFDVPAGALARDVGHAKEIADRIGYPVALKVQAAAIAHKSDMGGVKLKLADAAALERAWREIEDALAARAAGVTIDGMLVEAMAPPFQLELVVSALRDPEWGVVVVVGLGGVLTELMADIRMFPAGIPLVRIEAELKRLKGAALLDGYRGGETLDIAAVADVLDRLGRRLLDDADITEIEINPLVVYPRGQGVRILDALVSRRT